MLSVLAACDPGSQSRLDKETFDAEQRRREPRRLKEGEISAAARAQGQALLNLLQNQAGAGSGCCPTVPEALQDSLRQLQTNVRCFSLSAGNPAEAESVELQLLDAYRYNQEQGMPLEVNLQPLGKEGFIFTAPVVAEDAAGEPCAIWSIRLNRRQVITQIE